MISFIVFAFFLKIFFDVNVERHRQSTMESFDMLASDLIPSAIGLGWSLSQKQHLSLSWLEIYMFLMTAKTILSIKYPLEEISALILGAA